VAGDVRGCDEASTARPRLGCLFLAVAKLAVGLSQVERFSTLLSIRPFILERIRLIARAHS
jgi:hypothetical protein